MATKATKQRAAPAAQETAQQQAERPMDATRLTPAGHVGAALSELEALGALRTYNQVNALAYLKQAASWLERDAPKSGK